MTQTLYLTYRPQDFDSVVGQEIPRITIKNAAKLGKISHAYLFTGPRGTGKTSMARIVAKTINCTQLKEDGNPCNSCSICTSINEGRNVDIIEIDAASHTSVDDIRDLIDKARFMPNESRKKVYIVDEVHMLSKSAFNALLKTLEEPPEHVHFILATTEIHKVPDTIISRCQKFDFKRIEIKDIVYYLKYIAEKEGITYEIKALNLIAKISEGGLRNAIGIFQKVVFDQQITYEKTIDTLDVTGIHIIEGLCEDLEHKRIQQALTKINDLYEGGASLTQFTKDFIEFLREKMLDSLRQNDILKSQLYLEMIEYCDKAYNDLKTSIIPQLPLEIAITRICLGDSFTKKTQEKEEEVIPKKEEIKKDPPIPSEKTNTKDVPQEPPICSLSTIQHMWEQLTDGLEPKLRHAFKNASPSALSNETLTLSFRSTMYHEMASHHTAKAAIENILQKTFSQSLSVQTLFEKAQQPPTEKNTPTAISAEEAAELLGGDIIAE